MEKINRQSYVEIINANIAAVNEHMPSGLESDHIKMVLAQSVDLNYPVKQEKDLSELEQLKRKVDFYRTETAKIRDYVFDDKNECGKPCQSIFEAITDKIDSLKAIIAGMVQGADPVEPFKIPTTIKEVEEYERIYGPDPEIPEPLMLEMWEKIKAKVHPKADPVKEQMAEAISALMMHGNDEDCYELGRAALAAHESGKGGGNAR